MISKSPYMEAALQEARESVEKDEVPIGAVIVDRAKKEIISIAGNEVEKFGDPTAHAEIIAIKKALAKRKEKWLQGCDIYVTLEPCPMCAQAISLARLDGLYFGAYDPKSGGVESGPRVLHSSSTHHKPEIYGGIMERECGELLREFFKGKRK